MFITCRRTLLVESSVVLSSSFFFFNKAPCLSSFLFMYELTSIQYSLNSHEKNSRIQLIILSFSIKFSVNLLILSWACDYNLTNFTHHYHHILIFPTLYRVSLCIYLLALFCRRTRYNKKKMLLNFFFLLFLLCFHFILNKNYLLLLYNVFL
ncbi:hypothetical protein, no similarity [Maudiozyma barnettii]|uniref:Uncharacterized protein n=1 Tax=Maudiozyma barnettii TaxID=61262 RepID=A0A8H2VFE5_9SACH|nr:hypothetical protein, no similarity [Kazachstania barnettii]CAB4254470.1 hypothetical protein, no similarity [Kazachstania barnettii]CAD1782451.1 hypothetical protein, no similarity [Kazachstania barnettii]